MYVTNSYSKYERDYIWKLIGINEVNLVLMPVNIYILLSDFLNELLGHVTALFKYGRI